jgi:hypothetical protein
MLRLGSRRAGRRRPFSQRAAASCPQFRRTRRVWAAPTTGTADAAAGGVWKSTVQRRLAQLPVPVGHGRGALPFTRNDMRVCEPSYRMAAALRLRVDQHRNAHVHAHASTAARCVQRAQHAAACSCRRHVHGEPLAFDHGPCPRGAHDTAANDADHRALLRRGSHRLLCMHHAQRRAAGLCNCQL